MNQIINKVFYPKIKISIFAFLVNIYNIFIIKIIHMTTI